MGGMVVEIIVPLSTGPWPSFPDAGKVVPCLAVFGTLGLWMPIDRFSASYVAKIK